MKLFRKLKSKVILEKMARMCVLIIKVTLMVIFKTTGHLNAT